MRKLIYTILWITVLMLRLYMPASASNYPLEIINIKPSGTGSPSIPSTNRIFMAYPGIEYNIRAAVIGGLYPYTYSLSNAPAGMTINQNTGRISWPNPQSNASSITLSVTDSENTTVTTTWSITVTTSGFWFVDSSYGGTSTGSITQPFKTILEMLQGTSLSNQHDIVYIRGGNYTLAEYWTNPVDSGYMIVNLQVADNQFHRPYKWIGYPGEVVNINCNNVRIYSEWFYYDNLNFSNMIYYGIKTSGSNHYNTCSRTKWDTLDGYTGSNVNQGFIFAYDGGVQGSYLVVQDSEFTGNTGSEGVGSLYQTHKTLMEDNYFHDGSYVGAHAFTSPIGFKVNNTRYTVRHNRIYLPSTAGAFENFNARVGMTYDDEGEYCYNFFSRVVGWTTYTITFFYPTYVYIYRNTFAGGIQFRPAYSTGPYYFTNNVLIGSLTDATYVTLNNNLVGTTEDGIIDGNGMLIGSYRTTYLGAVGWELLSASTTVTSLTITGGSVR